MTSETNAQVLTLPDDEAKVKRIWKAFWVLLVLTILELACGLLIYQLDKGNPSYSLILFIKGCIVIFTIGKAFYIISIFMHLGDEFRYMVLSMAIPMCLFIWCITAFLVDGNSYRNLRNTDAGSRQYQEQELRYMPMNVPPGVENKYKAE